jgi:hypothetical protein
MLHMHYMCCFCFCFCSYSEALSVFSMEVADVLSQRALEVSFASAMSGSMSGAGAAQEQLTSMLKAQLLDYFSTTS